MYAYNRLMRYLCSAFILALMPLLAYAHPHIWAYTTLQLATQNNFITGIKVSWAFDELYSTSFLQEADTNGNKKLDPEETAHTIKAVFTDGQADLFPFMHMAPNGQKTPFTLQNPKIWMEKDILHYQFDIVLTTPQPLKGTHQFGIYDPDFYVAFEQDLDIILPANAKCTQNLQESPSIRIYGGLVSPEIYTLTCT